MHPSFPLNASGNLDYNSSSVRRRVATGASCLTENTSAQNETMPRASAVPQTHPFAQPQGMHPGPHHGHV